MANDRLTREQHALRVKWVQDHWDELVMFIERQVRGRTVEERDEETIDLLTAVCKTVVRWEVEEPLAADPKVWLMDIAGAVVNQRYG